MEGFFGHDSQTYTFVIFSVIHFIVLGLFFLLTAGLYIYRKHIVSYEKEIRISFFTSLFVLEFLYHYWLYSGGYWDVKYTLPFQLCSISLILSLILLVTNWKGLAEVLYFIGGAGAFAAIVTPELFEGFPHFRFFQFFITHMLIIWTALFYVWVKGYRPTFRGLWKAVLVLNVFAGIAFVVNRITGGNYMFLAQKPENASLIDYLGPYPYYIIALEGLAISLFTILWLPFGIKTRAKKPSASVEKR